MALVQASADTVLWRCSSGELLVRSWQDDAAVFHAASCSTHRVTPTGATVLKVLAENGAALGCAQVWKLAFGEEPSDDDLVMLLEMLQRLAQAGLVTALPA